MLETVFYTLRLFVVGGERIAMVMVVVGHICTQSYTTVSTILISCLKLFMLPWQHVTSIISISKLTFIVCIVLGTCLLYWLRQFVVVYL